MSSLKDKTVTMAHGAGGRQTSELIDQIFAAHFANPDLTADDAAVLTPPAGKMAVKSGFAKCAAAFPDILPHEVLISLLSEESCLWQQEALWADILQK